MSSHRAHAPSRARCPRHGLGLTGTRRLRCLVGSLGIVAGALSLPGCMSALTATTLREALRETAASLSTPHDLDHASQVAAKKRPDREEDTEEPAEGSADALDGADDVAMEEVIDNAVARLSAAGGIDPATQELLIQTLEKTPPQDWAVVVNEFAATLEAARGTAPRTAPRTGDGTPRGGSAETVPAAAVDVATVAAPRQGTGGLVMPAAAASAPAPLDIVGIEVAPLQPPVPAAAPAPPVPDAAVVPAAPQPAVPPPAVVPPVPQPAVPQPAVVQPAVALIEPSATVAPVTVAVAPMPPEPEAFDVAERRDEAPPVAVPAPPSGPVVNNACFATRVRGWGQVERFPGNGFRPGQEVIVYFELDRLRIDVSEQGHTTGIDTAFRLLDGAGEQVGQWSFEPIEETCPSPRRDYFVRYFLRIPESAKAGRHRLEWTVTDTVAGAARQAHLDLDVVRAE